MVVLAAVMSVYPSGAAWATKTEPAIELAPGRFSITNDWP